MTAPNLLWTNFGSTNPGVYYGLDPSGLTQLGGNIGTLEYPFVTPFNKIANRSISFLGGYYTVQKGTVYKLISNVWTSVHAVAAGSVSSNAECSGLHVATANGIQVLCYLAGVTSGATGTYLITFDGTTWVETKVSTDFFHATGGSGREVLVDSKLFVATHSGSTGFYNTAVTLIDIIQKAATQPTNTGFFDSVGAQGYDAVKWNNRIFRLLIANSNAFKFELQELQGTTWIQALIDTNTPDDTFGTANTQGSYGLFVDGGELYGIHFIHAAGTWGILCRQYHMNGSGVLSVVGEITTTVIPAALRPGVGSGSATDLGYALTIYQDEEDVPGSVTTYLIINLGLTTGTAWQVWKWNGNASLMTAVGSPGLDKGWAPPSNIIGGGSRTFNPSNFKVEIISIAQSDLGMTITYKPFSASGTLQASISFYFDLKGQPPVAVCSLTGTSDGNISGGNVIQGVTFDGSAKTVTWAFANDGVSSDQNFRIAARAFN